MNIKGWFIALKSYRMEYCSVIAQNITQKYVFILLKSLKVHNKV